ncbi:OmpP1/FadL family transporter [Capnocytophaga sp.]|uniref:OmpP1/FadL family transporter n=1 Tax=Capnocytophaga sp. TaxID=44737 RepID=UPI0026DAF8EE|nr:outer membrane protein transport protein [Capnocytophaga sp.]MDO5104886.1 outer membrane protein transport protein [Capnocytophaga sp.]
MKKFIYPFIFSVLYIANIQAQNYTDALRYSTEDLNGSSRFKAMSGAFGALGGDLSALNINPAGSAVFAGTELSFSIRDNRDKKNISFVNQNSTNKDSDFDVNQFGMVFVVPNVSTNWKKISFGFNFQQSKNLKNSGLVYFGETNIGLDNYFHHFAQNGNNNGSGFPLSTFADGNLPITNQGGIGEFYLGLDNQNARNAYLGIKTELVIPNSPNASETNYIANADRVFRRQKYEVVRNGQINKYNFNFASQFGDNIYLGLNLNSHTVYTNSLYSLSENNFEDKSLVRYANHQTKVNTTGSGFSFQLGGIAKINEQFRLGISYSSPTWYSLEEQSREVLYASIFNTQKKINEDKDVDLLNRYGDEIWFERKYKFRTPGSWTGSLAYIFGKRGLISFDYIYKNYENINFSSENLKGENKIIQDMLGNTSSIRVGGEYRINALSLRAGIRYEQSPYKGSVKYVGDLNGYSFGAGYSFGGIRLDVSYDIAKQDYMYQMYETVLTTPAKISASQSSLLFTLSAKLF